MSERAERLAEIRRDADAIAEADYCHVAKWGEDPRDYQHVAEQVAWLLSEVERLTCEKRGVMRAANESDKRGQKYERRLVEALSQVRALAYTDYDYSRDLAPQYGKRLDSAIRIARHALDASNDTGTPGLRGTEEGE